MCIPVDTKDKERLQFEMEDSKTDENLDRNSQFCQCLYS